MKYLVFLGKNAASSVALDEKETANTFTGPLPDTARLIEADTRAEAILRASAQRAEEVKAS